jgi:hypothetical protein
LCQLPKERKLYGHLGNAYDVGKREGRYMHCVTGDRSSQQKVLWKESFRRGKNNQAPGMGERWDPMLSTLQRHVVAFMQA